MDYLSSGMSLYGGKKSGKYFNNMGVRVLWQEGKKKVDFVGLTPGMCSCCFSVFYVCQKCQSARCMILFYVHIL